VLSISMLAALPSPYGDPFAESVVSPYYSGFCALSLVEVVVATHEAGAGAILLDGQQDLLSASIGLRQ